MKKSLLASALVLAASPAFAVQFGTAVDWSLAENDNQVYLPCTGTVVGGSLVLTADHCSNSTATFGNGDVINVTERFAPFELVQGDDRYIDIALFKLEDKPQVTSFVALSPNAAKAGDIVTMYGFGSYEAVSSPQLSYGVRQVVDLGYDETNFMFTTDINQGRSVEGDSGGMTLVNGALGAITTNGMLGDDIVNHVKLSNPVVRNWILDTVNDWHSPTVVKTDSVTSFQVQSLHNQDMGDLLNLISTSGDASVSLDNIQCRSMETKLDSEGFEIPASVSDVKPFDMCEIVVSSTGYEGFVTLGDYTVTINPDVHPEPETEDPQPEITPPTEGGSGGGSLGLLGLLGLGFIALKRAKK